MKNTLTETENALEQAQIVLDGLLSSVSNFCNWWTGMATELGVIEVLTPEFADDGSDPFPETGVQRRWAKLGEKYTRYVLRVTASSSSR
jgi:hypothetical protein